MCTIVLAWRALADAPVAVAANRDEALDRESRPPRVLEEDPQVLAPQDARAGGTWIGVSERGLLVAITNRWSEPPDAAGEESDAGDQAESEEATDGDGGTDARRSRGLLVRDALRAPDADAAVEVVRAAVATDDYAGFNLLVADPRRATYLEWDGADEPASDATQRDALSERDLDPGVHAIVNPGLNDVDDRAVALREELAVEGASPAAGAWLDAAASRLADHDYGVCVHGDGFGTRSSSLVAVFDSAGTAVSTADSTARETTDATTDAMTDSTTDGTASAADAPVPAAYAYADGPPCETRYEQVDPGGSFLEGSF